MAIQNEEVLNVKLFLTFDHFELYIVILHLYSYIFNFKCLPPLLAPFFYLCSICFCS